MFVEARRMYGRRNLIYEISAYCLLYTYTLYLSLQSYWKNLRGGIAGDVVATKNKSELTLVRNSNVNVIIELQIFGFRIKYNHE